MVGAKVLILEHCQPDTCDYKITEDCPGEGESVISSNIFSGELIMVQWISSYPGSHRKASKASMGHNTSRHKAGG